MSWYKKAQENLWQEIEEKGPYSYIERRKRNRSTEQINMEEGEAREASEAYWQEYGWSVPTKEAIKKIKQFVGGENIIEIGSGLGLWAKLMQDAGINIVPTNRLPTQEDISRYYINKEKQFTPIEELTHMEAIQKYINHGVLMLVFPPQNTMANETLNSFKGNKLIYIGEINGNTADDNFFINLNKNWKQIEKIQLPRFDPTTHESVYLFIRK